MIRTQLGEHREAVADLADTARTSTATLAGRFADEVGTETAALAD